MKLEAIQAAEAKLLLPTYERNPILFVGGSGMYLIDDNGERYLDLLSGIGVNALGYAHPAVTHAIEQQSRKLVHISNLYFHEGQAELALRLTERTGLDRAFFCNSGTEAWEAAMKLARAYSSLKRSEGKAWAPGFWRWKTASMGGPWGRYPLLIRKSTANRSSRWCREWTLCASTMWIICAPACRMRSAPF